MLRSSVLVILATLVLGAIADHGSVLVFPYGRRRTEGHEHDNGAMTGCDDCAIKAHPILYNAVRFRGKDYGAFAVHSNGLISLYPDSNYKVVPYSYNGERLDTTSTYRPPLIAPFWNDIDLHCEAYHSEENAVYFEETTDPASLSVCASIVSKRTGDLDFRPQSMLVFTWYRVQRYRCPEDKLANTFQVLVAMERIPMERSPGDEGTPTPPVLTSTYAVMLYRSIQWEFSDSEDVETSIGVGVDTLEETVNLMGGVNASVVDSELSGIVVFRVDDELQLFHPVPFLANVQEKLNDNVVIEKNPKKGTSALLQELVKENIKKYKKRGH